MIRLLAVIAAILLAAWLTRSREPMPSVTLDRVRDAFANGYNAALADTRSESRLYQRAEIDDRQPEPEPFREPFGDV